MTEMLSTDCDLCEQSFPDLTSLVQHQIWYHAMMEQDFMEVDDTDHMQNINQLDGQDQSFDESMSEMSVQQVSPKVLLLSYNYLY